MKIAVLFGGNSSERDVSVASASKVIGALRESGHEVVAVDAARGIVRHEDERKVLRETVDPLPPDEIVEPEKELAAIIVAPEMADVDLVFLALHGGSGENGTAQRVLGAAGLAFTGTDSDGSALAMDKNAAKLRFLEAGVPTAEWLMAPAATDQVEERLGFPVIVKPNSEGSTVGLTLVSDSAELQAAIDYAARFDRQVMLERYIPGREITVGILDDVALAAGEIISLTGEIFDYTAKYQADSADEIFPADLDAGEASRAKELALIAHRALGLQSYSRVDFRMDHDGEFWCLEVNTLPGMTPNSLLPQSASALGIRYPDLCERICLGALAKHTDGES
ncbi:MAG: D-alanine--D-alanine ligase family protein [Gammaproteobacteria bacterium]